MTEIEPFTPTRAQATESAFWAAIGAAGRYALAGIVTLALTRLLAPHDFGLIAIAYAAQALIAHVIPTGFHDALIQRPRLESADLNAAFWSVAALSVGALLLVLAVAPSISAWFDQPALAWLLVGMALASLPRALSAAPRALLNRHLDFRRLALIRLAGMAVGGFCAIALAALGAGAWSLIAQVATLNLVSAILLWRAARWRPERPTDLSADALSPLWRFAPSVSLFAVASYILTKADDQLVGYRLGPEALGFYALAYGLMAWPVRDVLGNVSGVLYPVFARFQDDLPRLRSAYLESLQLCAAFAFPTLAFLIITAPVLIPWLLGARWQPSVFATQILALGGLGAAPGMINGPVYRALGKPHLHVMFQLCSLGPMLAAIIVGLDYGIEGVAFFTVLAATMLRPVAWWMAFSIMGLSWRAFARALLPIVAAVSVMSLSAAWTLYAAQHLWALNEGLALVLTGAVAGASYSGMLVLLRPIGVRRSVCEGWQFGRALVSKRISVNDYAKWISRSK